MVLLKLFAFLGLLLIARADLRRGSLKALHEPTKIHPAVRAFTTGSNFVFAIPNSHNSNQDTSYTENIFLLVTNYDVNHTSTVIVSTPSLLFNTTILTIPPLQTKSLLLPPEIQTNYRNVDVNYFKITNQSIYLNANTSVSVVVRSAHSNAYSEGMYVVYPACSLGTTYRTVGDQTSPVDPVTNIWSIVALQDNTTVTITPPVTSPPTNTLNAGQVLTVAANIYHLINFQIDSNMPVAVITGAVCGYGPVEGPVCDYEVSMMFPGPASGSAFPVTQFAFEDQGNILILAESDSTLLTVNGRTIEILDDFQYVVLPVTGSAYLTTSKPVYVFSVSTTRQDGQGAPFIVHLPAVSQFTNQSYIQVTTGLTDKTTPQHFIRLETSMTSTENNSKFLIDGVPVSGQLFQKQGTSTYYMVDYPVAPGTHFIQTTDPTVKYAAIVYGFADVTAYAYTPGIDLPTVGNC